MNQPIVSVVILNYNGSRWLEKCFASLQDQTIFKDIQVIVADNLSTDNSDQYAESVMDSWTNGIFVQNGANLGFCEGNNKGALLATGKYLLFLNNDAWLERDCLEILVKEVEIWKAGAACPLILDYDSDHFQNIAGKSFDVFGIGVSERSPSHTCEWASVTGCAYFINRQLFNKIEGFDKEYFSYSEENDLSFRVLIAGEKIVAVPQARIHHRGAANVNPKGGERIVEFRTSERNRFLVNRNGLMTLLKNFQHILLITAVFQLGLLFLEACIALLFLRRWSFVKNVYVNAIADCWRLRFHIKNERRRIQLFRKRSDFWLLRFLTWKISRLAEIKRLLKMGLPIIEKSN